jgi:DNA-binding beta-propeller fold protein YncE
VTALNQPAKDLKFDPVHNVIYLSVPGSANSFANTIAVLDPVSATVVGEQFAGSEPNHLALSDDEQFLYASIDGSNSVQRFILPTLQPDVSYGLGDDSRWGPYYALDLQVAPGAPHTTAVSLGVTPVSPLAQGGLVIFDDATPRPVTIPGADSTTNLFDCLQWGYDATSLFAANLESTGDDFYTIAVTPNGASLTADYPGLVKNARIHFDPVTKLVYADDGQVVNPATGTNAASFVNAASSMVPDSNLNLAFFVNASESTVIIQSFNLTTRALVDSIAIPNVFTNYPQHVIRWGQNGLAFTTDTGQLFLVGGNFIH